MLFFSVKVQLSLMSFVGDFVLIEVICQKNSKLNEPYQVEFFKKGNTSEMYTRHEKKIYNDFTFNHAFQEKIWLKGYSTYIRGLALKKSCASRWLYPKGSKLQLLYFSEVRNQQMPEKRVSFIHSYLFYNPALDWT